MTKSMAPLLVLSFVAAGLLALPATMVAEERNLIEEARKMAEPGPAHLVLESLVGKWKVRAQYRVTPDSNPELASGKAKTKWAIDRRFLLQEIRIRMGRGFEGLGVWGFDNFTRRYTGSWMNSSDTGITHIEGDWDEARQTLMLTLRYNDIRYEGKQTGYSELRIVDKNNHSWFIYESHPETGARITRMRMDFIRDER